MRLWRHPLVIEVAAIALGLVFLYAAHEKIEQPEQFARAIYHYHLIGPNEWLPPLVPNLLAVVLPWIEVIVGVLLIRGAWRREAAFLTAAMLTIFILAVGSTLWRGIDLENCGCFSLDAHGRAVGIKLILQDLALLAGATLVALVRPASSPPSTPKS